MAALDRSIAEAERSFERIRRDAAENELYGRFKQRWNDYRTLVNQIVGALACEPQDGGARDLLKAPRA